jgi:hypothetical protein
MVSTRTKFLVGTAISSQSRTHLLRLLARKQQPAGGSLSKVRLIPRLAHDTRAGVGIDHHNVTHFVRNHHRQDDRSWDVVTTREFVDARLQYIGDPCASRPAPRCESNRIRNRAHMIRGLT